MPGYTPCNTITLGDIITHPLGRVSEPVLSKPRRSSTHKQNGDFGNVSSRPFHERVARRIQYALPVSRQSASKIVEGGVLSYHPSLTFDKCCTYGTPGMNIQKYVLMPGSNARSVSPNKHALEVLE